jgi:two-component system response regulator VicR
MSKRILVIDDDEDILQIMNIIFQEEGYEVVLSNTAETADHVQVIHPDLILLDVRILGSNKSGLEICADIKRKYHNLKLPVILVSAESDLATLAEQCGADGYITKPFDVDELVMHVKEYIN